MGEPLFSLRLILLKADSDFVCSSFHNKLSDSSFLCEGTACHMIRELLERQGIVYHSLGTLLGSA